MGLPAKWEYFWDISHETLSLDSLKSWRTSSFIAVFTAETRPLQGDLISIRSSPNSGHSTVQCGVSELQHSLLYVVYTSTHQCSISADHSAVLWWRVAKRERCRREERYLSFTIPLSDLFPPGLVFYPEKLKYRHVFGNSNALLGQLCNECVALGIRDDIHKKINSFKWALPVKLRPPPLA